MSLPYSRKDYVMWYPQLITPQQHQELEVPISRVHISSTELCKHIQFLPGDDGDDAVQYIADH